VTKIPRICGVILAAGASSRMGRDKALLPWPPMQAENSPQHGTFLSAAILRLKGHTESVVVVAGNNASAIQAVVSENAAVLRVNSAPELGQFSSLKIGLQEARNRGCDAVIIAPVDRPPVAEEMIVHLRTAFLAAINDGYWAAIPEFEGRHGHPVMVGSALIDELLGAPLTATARDIIHAHEDRVLYVPVDDPAVVLNVNTWEEYQRLSTRQLR